MFSLFRAFFFVSFCGLLASARADTQIFVGGGLSLPNLSTTLSDATNTTPTYALSASAEIVRNIKKGRFSLGLRAGYLMASVSTSEVELSYSQLPVFATGGIVLGASRRMRLRLTAGAGYALKNSMTFVGSGSTTDGDYAATGLLGLANAQLLLFPGKKSRLGVFGEAGYVYAFNRILYHDPFTSPDLDANTSGIFFQGGLILRF